jgi:hypothetical protein
LHFGLSIEKKQGHMHAMLRDKPPCLELSKLAGVGTKIPSSVNTDTGVTGGSQLTRRTPALSGFSEKVLEGKLRDG